MTALPDGLLVAWYGDDFTGTAAVMEAMTFAGLPSAVFFDLPTPSLLARFHGLRGIGLAGSARAEPPGWMRANLPAVFRGLAATGAPLLQYKICSTLDSSPRIGSIGTAMDIARDVLGTKVFPILPAAPVMGRYQAFGNLYATAPGGTFRLDRHPVMSVHPVTPMDEADVALHLARQTDLPIRNLSLSSLHREDEVDILRPPPGSQAIGITIDAVTPEDLVAVGRRIWTARSPELLCVASQGLQYALLAFWRSEGLLGQPPQLASAGKAGPVAVVSGSVSPTTKAQIEHAAASGFRVLDVGAQALVEQPNQEVARVASEAIAVIRRGEDVLLTTALGPADPAVARFSAWKAQQLVPETELNRRVGDGLGEILLQIVRATGIRRAVISGGDTSGYAAKRLGLVALTALAPTIPGAALCLAHSNDEAIDGLELALKGGQMGTPDYFSWIRDGAGPRSH